jgi:asparagine synthase (glutamine-hydrolysing)
MSGIVGMWNLDGRPVEREVLSTMSATLAHRGPDGEEQWISGPVGLSCQLMRVTPESLHETQPLVHPAGAVVVFDGRLDNREELLGLLKGAWGAEPDSPDPALVLAAYEAFGERFPERLNGDFALAIYDPNRKQLLLARDVIGLRTLYYHRTGNTFLFASDIKAILAHTGVVVHPNDDLIAEFLTRSYAEEYLGETFFEGIVNLLPGHLGILTPGGFKTHQSWDFDLNRTVRLRSYSEYVEGFLYYFEQAVRRRIRSSFPVAVSVSGGVDSSAIFCMGETLRHRKPEGYPPLIGISYTCPDGSSGDEKAYLLEIERAYGCNIQRVPTRALRLSDNPKEDVWQEEAPVLEWDIFHQVDQKCHELGARVLLNGHGGDELLFNTSYLVDLFLRGAWEEIREHLHEFPLWSIGVPPGFYRNLFIQDLIRHYLPMRVFTWIRRIRAEFFPSAGSPWTLEWYSDSLKARALRRLIDNYPRASNKKLYCSAYKKVLYKSLKWHYHQIRNEWLLKVGRMHCLELAQPFFDRDLVSFLMAIPGEEIVHKGIPKNILRSAMAGVLPEAIRNRRTKADFTKLSNEGIEQDFQRMAQYLEFGGSVAGFGYIKPEEIGKELRRLKSRLVEENTFHAARNIAYLVGLELWLQVYFGGASEKIKNA